MNMHKLFVGAMIGAAALSPSAFAQYAAELSPVLSRLQSLSHATYSQAEWDRAMLQLDEVEEKAVAAGQVDLVVQARAVKAMALADMKQDLHGALSVLKETRDQYGKQKIPNMRRIFVQEADYYGRLGNAAAVRRVIEEFRKNPNFDAQQYSVELYEGRNTPMMIMRPSAAGDDSISVTAMDVARDRAGFAPGHSFPNFSWTDEAGRSQSLQALQGKVVLVDFWHPAWTPWVRSLPNLKKTYAAYHHMGFEIVGVALERNAGAARASATQQGLSWPLVFGETELPRQLSLFGEASNFLLNENGVIIARNVRATDLPQLLREALRVR